MWHGNWLIRFYDDALFVRVIGRKIPWKIPEWKTNELTHSHTYTRAHTHTCMHRQVIPQARCIISVSLCCCCCRCLSRNFPEK